MSHLDLEFRRQKRIPFSHTERTTFRYNTSAVELLLSLSLQSAYFRLSETQSGVYIYIYAAKWLLLLQQKVFVGAAKRDALAVCKLQCGKRYIRREKKPQRPRDSRPLGIGCAMSVVYFLIERTCVYASALYIYRICDSVCILSFERETKKKMKY